MSHYENPYQLSSFKSCRWFYVNALYVRYGYIYILNILPGHSEWHVFKLFTSVLEALLVLESGFLGQVEKFSCTTCPYPYPTDVQIQMAYFQYFHVSMTIAQCTRNLQGTRKGLTRDSRGTPKRNSQGLTWDSQGTTMEYIQIPETESFYEWREHGVSLVGPREVKPGLLLPKISNTRQTPWSLVVVLLKKTWAVALQWVATLWFFIFLL